MNLTKQQYADMEMAFRTCEQNRIVTQAQYYQRYHTFRAAAEWMQGKLDMAGAVARSADAQSLKLEAENAKLRKVINIGNKLRRTGPPCKCKTCVKLQGLYDQALQAADIDQREGKGGEDD